MKTAVEIAKAARDMMKRVRHCKGDYYRGSPNNPSSDWQDDPERTKAQVLRAFDDAISLLENGYVETEGA